MLATSLIRQDPPVSPPTPPAELLGAVRSLELAHPLFERLAGVQRPVYLVGGAVRDLLLGRVPRELDLVVEEAPAWLVERLGSPARSHARFGTWVAGGYDIARTRRESYARPGALPDVVPATLREDLPRRDFTVNAIALALTGPGAGELIHVEHALEDLSAGRLRVLHEESFRDDPTRLLRLARYGSRLGFAPDSRTATLAEEAVAAGALRTVSGARIGHELRLLAEEPDPVSALQAAREFAIADSIAPGFGIEDPALARRALAWLGERLRAPDDGYPWMLALGLALRGTDHQALQGRLASFDLSGEARERITAVAVRADAVADALRAAGTPSEIVRAAGEIPAEALALAAALGADAEVAEWWEMARHVRLQIDGHDLIAAGIRPGWALGRGLQAALSAKLDGRAPTRARELAIALAAAREAELDG